MLIISKRSNNFEFILYPMGVTDPVYNVTEMFLIFKIPYAILNFARD